MAKIAESGFLISRIDRKALEHYLLLTPKEWAEGALKGMINKAVTTIFRDWFDAYKATQTETVSTDPAVSIPAILALPNFVPYNTPPPAVPVIHRKIAADQEIWEGGFDIEDYELDALNAFYSNPENHLRFFMENKIDARRKAIVKAFEDALIANPETTSMPVHADDLIAQETAKEGYKNRAQREAK